MKIVQNIFTLTILFGVLIISGCHPTIASLLGATARDDTLIALSTQGGESERWQDFHLVVDYTLDRQSDRLAISGNFSFTEYVQLNMRRVRDVRLWLFLLDDQKRVVEYQEVGRTVSSDVDDRTSIKGNLLLSAAVTAIAFGYRGGFAADWSEVEHIWKLPHVNK